MRDLLNSRDHNLTAELAALLASELATNAVRHAQTSFVVRVRLDGNHVRLEVEDGGSDIARMPTNPSMDGAGRGLQLVAGLTRHWGVELNPDGKTVWCELDIVEPRQPSM